MRAELALCAALAALAACDSASSSLGYDAMLQLRGAQFRPGAFPAAGAGPAVVDFQTGNTTVTIGEEREQLTAHLAPAARGAIIGLRGDLGAWIVTAGTPDNTEPNDATLSAIYGLAEHTPAGPLTLELAATDADGAVGTPATVDLIAAPATPPTGMLVVSLTWDSTADLDLHVVDPLGGEAYAGNPNTYQAPPPGSAPPNPTAYLQGGILDRDANADCVQDGHPEEDVVWTMPPPAGAYTVRVEATAMCSDAAANWLVTAYGADGSKLAAAAGVATAADVSYGTHGEGGGVTAMTFTVP